MREDDSYQGEAKMIQYKDNRDYCGRKEEGGMEREEMILVLWHSIHCLLPHWFSWNKGRTESVHHTVFQETLSKRSTPRYSSILLCKFQGSRKKKKKASGIQVKKESTYKGERNLVDPRLFSQQQPMLEDNGKNIYNITRKRKHDGRIIATQLAVQV